MNQENYLSYFTPRQLADILNISRGYMYALLKQLNIEGHRVSKYKRTLLSDDVRKIMFNRKYKYKNKIFNFHSLKGGTGKTTMALALAKAALNFGFRVLLIDLDPQSNLTTACGLTMSNGESLAKMIVDKTPFNKLIHNVIPYLSIVPSSLSNSMLDKELYNSKIPIQSFLSNLLKPLKNNYDLFIIDCPPALSLSTVTASCASDLTIIPVNMDKYAMAGMYMTINEIEEIKSDLNTKIDYKVLVNKFDSRKSLSGFYIDKVYNNTSTDNLNLIRVCSTFEKAQCIYHNIFSFPRSYAQDDIIGLAIELLNINEVIK